MGSFQFVSPKVRHAPPVQSMCYYMVNQYGNSKIRPMRLGVANNMHPLCLGAQTEKIPNMFQKDKNGSPKEFHQQKKKVDYLQK